MEFYVYILYSRKLDRYYVGHTNNLERRLNEHQIGHEKYTRKGVPWELVYSKQYSNKKDAHQEEMRIRRRKSRKYIEYIIKQV